MIEQSAVKGSVMTKRLTFPLLLLVQFGVARAGEGPGKPVAPDAHPLEKWVDQLQSEDASERAIAASKVGEYLRSSQSADLHFSDLPRKNTEEPSPTVSPVRLAQLIIALRQGLADKDEEVRKQSAIALASIDSKSAELEAVLFAGLQSRDRNVRWYSVQQIQELRPDPKRFVPLLLTHMKEDAQDAWWYAWAIGDYEKEAQFIAPELAKLLSHPEEEIRQWAATALRHVGVDAETARKLMDGTIKWNESAAADVFIALFSQPQELGRFAESHPKMGKELEERIRFIYPNLCKGGKDAALLQEALSKLNPTSPLIMGILQDEKFLPVLDEQMKTADPHTRTLLEACARACGRAPTKVVKILKEQPGEFKPTSALSGGENKRKPKEMQGHGDGFTRVLVTGTLLMENGKPARRPQFFAANDRMLLGVAEHQPESIFYNPKTGRFVFLTSVFAAYAMEEGAAEPGPYQTGSALTLIEAEGAEPLQVRFFDEMPDVEITLKAGDGRTQPRPAIKSRKSGVIGGFMPPPSRD